MRTKKDTAQQSIGHLLRHQAEALKDKTLLRFEGMNMSFAEVEESTNRLANVLKLHHVDKGDKVAVMMPNGFDFPITWLAIAKAGAVMVPVNVQYLASEVEHTLTDSGAKLALCGTDQAEILRQVQPRCKFLDAIAVFANTTNVFEGIIDIRDEMRRASNICPIEEIAADDLLNFQYTSGTTGFPKACMLTHEYWLQLARKILEYGSITPGDVNLTAQPFYYMDPQWNLMLCIMAGVPLVILPRFSASTFWQSVQQNEVTFFYVIATMPVYLLKQPEKPQFEKNHKVRFVICSGIVPSLHATFESRFGAPWRELYGTTEAGGVLQVPLENTDCVGTGTVGVPFPGKEVRIINENGEDVQQGEVGELIVRGEPQMLGYYNNPDATQEIIHDGWLHTGDLFRQDERGYFYIVGRMKDMVRRSGENISAAEVEGVLCEHPAVCAAAVIAVADELRAEEVKAFVQLQKNVALHPEELVQFAREKLAAFKVPRFIEFVEKFPLTPSERIAKYELIKRKKDQRNGSYDAATKKWG